MSAQSLRAHNTVAENGSGDGVGIGVGSGSAVGLVNTIVASQTVGISHTGGSTVLAQYTLFDANGLNYAGSVTSTNEISGPAGLMPANYHLRSGSGAIDRAYPLAADHRRGRRPAAARCGTRRGGGRGPVRPPAAGVAGLVNQSKGEHKMRTKHLIICLALGLGLAPLLFLLATLHTSHASSPVEQVRYVATTGRDSIPLGGGFFTPNNCLDSADPCRTVQRATDAAAPDDQIRVAAGIYTGVRARDGMTQVLHIAKSVTIRGGYTTTNWGASFPLTQPTTLDAQGLGRVVAITGSVAPTLDGLVIAHGNAAGQAADCPTIHGTPSGCGGGIFIYAASPLIVNSTITDNVASAAAGATGTGYGGGLYLKNAHGAVISGNVIISNVASLTGFGDGGGLYLDHSDAQVCANQVLDNYATKINTSGWGGGISAFSGAPTIENNVLRGNWVNPSGTNYPGAAIYLWNDSGTYSGNQITENHGQSAIFLSRGQPRLESNQVISNATAIGVELFSGPGAATLVNNIVARSGTQVIRAEGQSGQALTATLIHNSLVGSGGGSGIYVAGYTTVFVTNTIAVSATWGITNVSPASATVSADHNLFWANTYPGIQGTNPVNGNPHFVAPAGGDYHIGPGSAALDVGATTAITTDVDGDPRPIGPLPDIGADEAWRWVFLPLVLRDY